jgi:hypothetical protein
VKTRLAVLLALAPLACAHAGDGGSGSSSSGPPPPVIEHPIKHVVQPATVAPDLTGTSAPAVFEQMLCNRLFEYNGKQVICADDVRVFLEHKREQAMLSGEEVRLDDVLASMDAPRRVSLAAAKSGEAVLVTVLVQDTAGTTLCRVQKTLKADGADAYERATEAAIEILKVK